MHTRFWEPIIKWIEGDIFVSPAPDSFSLVYNCCIPIISEPKRFYHHSPSRNCHYSPFDRFDPSTFPNIFPFHRNFIFLILVSLRLPKYPYAFIFFFKCHFLFKPITTVMINPITKMKTDQCHRKLMNSTHCINVSTHWYVDWYVDFYQRIWIDNCLFYALWHLYCRNRGREGHLFRSSS